MLSGQRHDHISANRHDAAHADAAEQDEQLRLLFCVVPARDQPTPDYLIQTVDEI